MIEEIIRLNEKRIAPEVSKFKDIVRIDFIDIFPTSNKHKEELDREASDIAKIIDITDKGTFYLIDKPIITKWGNLRFLKIRYFDETRLNWEAAPDFKVVDWDKFKFENKNFKTISREKWEALEYKSDDALIYFLNPLVTEVYDVEN